MQTSRSSTIDTALGRLRALSLDGRRLRLRLCVFLLSLLSLCFQNQVASALDSGRLRNAKDMFYQELKQGNDGVASGPLSIAYCLELHRGSAAPVLCNNRYAFRSGDGIRLHVKASSPCYAYIVMVQGSSGKKAVLYPPPGSTENNRIEAGKECMVPPRGMIVFDNQPGTEKLGVIFSPQPLDNSRVLNTKSFPIDADALTGIPQKVGPYSVYSSDGVYELGAKAPGNGLVFVHNPKPGEPVLLGIVLNHGNAPPEPAPSPTPTPSPTPSPSPSTTNRPITDKWAFIVGINNFANFPGSKLRFCVSDATAVRDFLVNEAGFKPNHVYLLTDEQATTPNILRVMSDLLPRAIRRDDLVLLYFSTHGTPQMKGENWIVTYDFDAKGQTGIPMQKMGELIKAKIPSDRVVTILDTCFSGNARDLDQREMLDNLLQGSGQIIVSACSADEQSLEDAKLQHGYFTYYLIDSLRNSKALKQGFDQTKQQVTQHTQAEHHHSQHPIINYDRWRGNDLVLFARPTNPRN